MSRMSEETKNKLRNANLARRLAGPIEVKSPAQKAQENPRSLRFAINAKCYDCVCDQKAEVTRCVMTDCSLWNLRPWQNAEINEKILKGEIK